MLLKLANKTVVTAQQIAVGFRFGIRIRKSGTGNYIVRWGQASMRVRSLNRGSVDDETEQEKRKHARIRTARPY